MYYFPLLTICDWGGISFGATVFINGEMTTSVTVHELGHSAGLGHAHRLACTDGAGHAVTLSTTCTTDEYGDWYSVMGCCFAGSPTAIQKYALGWMSGRMTTVPSWGGTFTLQPIETTPLYHLQALRIEDGSQTLWIEYRQPIGVDATVPAVDTNGVFVHLQRPDDMTQSGSFLLDISPNDGDPRTLPVGATWVNPLGIMKITVNAADANTATVTVTPTVATVPPVVGDTLSAAAQALQAAGFVVGQKQYVIDYTCDNINLVVRQSPLAGTHAAPGTAVNLTFGKAPPPPYACQ
jgi:hypothetical protein